MSPPISLYKFFTELYAFFFRKGEVKLVYEYEMTSLF